MNDQDYTDRAVSAIIEAAIDGADIADLVATVLARAAAVLGSSERLLEGRQGGGQS
jgi:hypothetical protein